MIEHITSTHSKFPSKLELILINNKRLDGRHRLLKAWLEYNHHNKVSIKTLSYIAMYALEVLLAQCKQQVTPALLARVGSWLNIVDEANFDPKEAIRFVTNCLQFISYHPRVANHGLESKIYWKRAVERFKTVGCGESLESFSLTLFFLKRHQYLLQEYESKHNFVAKNTEAVILQMDLFLIYGLLIDFVQNNQSADVRSIYQELHQCLCNIGKYFDQLQQDREYGANPTLITRGDFTPSERAQQCYRSANMIFPALIRTKLDSKQSDAESARQVYDPYPCNDVVAYIFKKYTPGRVVGMLELTSKHGQQNPWKNELLLIDYWQRALDRQYPRFINTLPASYIALAEFKKLISEEQKQLLSWAKIFTPHELSEEQLAYLIAIRHGDLTRVAKFPYDDIDFISLIYASMFIRFTPDQAVMHARLDQRFDIPKSIIEWVRYRDDQEMLDLLYKVFTVALNSISYDEKAKNRNKIYLAAMTLQNYKEIKSLMTMSGNHITLGTSCDASRLHMNLFQILIASSNHNAVWQIIEEHRKPDNTDKLNALKFLLSTQPGNVQPNQAPQERRISLHLACESTGDSLPLVKFINNLCPEQRNEIEGDGGTAIEIAVERNKLNVVAYLLECGIEWERLQSPQSPPLAQKLIVNCIKAHHLDMARTLINGGAPCKLVGLLEQISPDFVQAEKTPADLIACLVEVILLLHARNPEGIEENNIKELTPLMIAARYNIPVIDTLIKLGANINARNESGRTALYYAVFYHRFDCVRELLKYKPSYLVSEDIDDQEVEVDVLSAFIITQYGGEHPQHKPVDIRGFIQGLVEAQYDINSMGVNGDTPLFHAVKMQEYNLIAALIDCGANLNQRYGKQKMTILHYAVTLINKDSFPSLGFIELLVNKSPALINARTDAGLTALALAQALRSADLFSANNPNDKILAYLEEVSASMMNKSCELGGQQQTAIPDSMPRSPGLSFFEQSPRKVATTPREDSDPAVMQWMPGTA